MNQKIYRLIYIAIALLLSALMLSGCSQDKQGNKEEIKKKMDEHLTPPVKTGAMTEQPAKTSMFTSESAAPSATKSAGPQPTPVHAKGEYTEKVDDTTIVVTLNGEQTKFNLNETTKMQIGLFAIGDTLGFDYTPGKAGQLTIVKFDDLDKNMIAKFEGQMDPHTIEVITDSGPIAFQLTGKALTQVESFKKDDRIQIVYFKNDKGQNVATALYLIVE